MALRTSLLLLCASALILRAGETAPPVTPPTPEAIEFFEKNVRPVLVKSCHECHGSEKKKGALRLDSRAAILSGGESGPAAVPGKSKDSILIHAINYKDETQMPPKKKLAEAEIAALTKWIDMGLPWPGGDANVAVEAPKAGFKITDEQRAFWSFQPMKKVAAPAVKDAAWAKGEIDKFVLAPLEAKGLKPASAADKRTLIRRATYDLCGLPPTVEQVEAFEKDESPDAFAKVVDRLLAAPQYGERWGRHWLDVVRYADSRDARGIGGASDIGEAWRYRDWVVKAFNDDLPYDQFIVRQIAGDLLPAANPGDVNAEGLIATGLLTIGEWGLGDADKEKMMTDIVDDQVDVVTRSFMGLTMACARCHDHKFDPLSHADYYAMAGIFFSTHIIPDPGKKTDGSPMLRTPLVSKDEVAKGEKHKKRMQELEKQLGAETNAAFAAMTQALLPETGKYASAALAFVKDGKKVPIADVAKEKSLQAGALEKWVALADQAGTQAPAYPLMGQQQRDLAGNPGVYQWKGAPDCPSVMINTNDNVVSITTLRLPPKSLSVHPGPNNGVVIGWRSPIDGAVRISGRVADGDNVCGDGISWAMDHYRSNGVTELASGEIPNNGAQVFDAAKLNNIAVKANELIYLAVLPKGEYTCDTTAIEWTIESADGKSSWRIPGDIVTDPLQGNPHADALGRSDVWRFCDMANFKRAPRPNNSLTNFLQRLRAAPDAAESEKVIADLQNSVNAAKPEDAIRKDLTAANGPFGITDKEKKIEALPAEARAKLDGMRAELEALKKTPPAEVPVALAAQDGGVPNSPHAGVKDARIHVRGSYTRLGDVVPRRFPTILAGEKQTPLGERTKASGRLELAQWIASPSHPLTARVMANRVWQQHFGQGLVRTPSNFGKLGEKPTHPELLDYLATRLIENGWSVKKLHREILLSAAYQTSSQPTAELLKADADNRMFGHMNRRRLEAEAVRDSLLDAAGRLDRKMGGPSDRDPNTKRRMLYLMSIRSDRSSFGPLFDAADSSAQIDTRTISTVAPQALYMLNNPFAVEQTKAFAARVIVSAPDDTKRIEQAYAWLYGRAPTERELKIGVEYLKGATDAQKGTQNLLKPWNEYAQILLCANEFVFVD